MSMAAAAAAASAAAAADVSAAFGTMSIISDADDLLTQLSGRGEQTPLAICPNEEKISGVLPLGGVGGKVNDKQGLENILLRCSILYCCWPGAE